MAVLIRQGRLALLLILLYAGLPSLAAGGESLQLHEPEIKAGLLYNFLKYVDWPPANLAQTTKMVVCILGGDPFEGYLDPMSGRSVKEREITIRYLRTAGDSASCHLLFVNAALREGWGQLRKSLAGRNILTVSDFSGFADAGGMLEFGRKDEHISVLLNMDAVTGAGLHVQDRLLKLVTVVHSPPQEGAR